MFSSISDNKYIHIFELHMDEVNKKSQFELTFLHNYHPDLRVAVGLLAETVFLSSNSSWPTAAGTGYFKKFNTETGRDNTPTNPLLHGVTIIGRQDGHRFKIQTMYPSNGPPSI